MQVSRRSANFEPSLQNSYERFWRAFYSHRVISLVFLGALLAKNIFRKEFPFGKNHSFLYKKQGKKYSEADFFYEILKQVNPGHFG